MQFFLQRTTDAKHDNRLQLNGQNEGLVAEVKARARNLYLTRQLLCTEAVLVSLNKGLNGGLSDAQAVAMAAPFCIALGESGCLCGALSGAVLGCGLLLGGNRPHRRRRELRDSAGRLHDAFRQANGATCCRILSRDVKHNEAIHFRRCADLTAGAAEMAVRLILEKRPELVGRADAGFLNQRQSRLGGALLGLLRFLTG